MEGFKLTILAAGSAEACRTVTKLGRPLPTVAPVEAYAIATHRWKIGKRKILGIVEIVFHKSTKGSAFSPPSSKEQKENPDLGSCEDTNFGPTERTVYF